MPPRSIVDRTFLPSASTLRLKSQSEAADVEALADTLVRVSYLAMRLEGHLAEMDINPLMVLPSGQGGEDGRRPRRVSRYIALHVAESVTQKFAASQA